MRAVVLVSGALLVTTVSIFAQTTAPSPQATGGEQEAADSKPAEGSHWVRTAAGDVITGLDGGSTNSLVELAAKKSNLLARRAVELQRLGVRLNSVNASAALREAVTIQAGHTARAAATLKETGRIAGRYGPWLAEWATPIVSLAGAAGAMSRWDWLGASQEALNGLGSIGATAGGALAGTLAGGPAGGLVGGIAGNTAYGHFVKPTVDEVYAWAHRGLHGQEAVDLWAAARKRIFGWLDQALALGAASSEALRAGERPGMEGRLGSLEPRLDGLHDQLDDLTQRRRQICTDGVPPDWDARRRSILVSTTAVRESLEETVRYETESCNLLQSMSGAEPAELARIWQGYVRYASGRAGGARKGADAGLKQAEDELSDLQDQVRRSRDPAEILSLRAEYEAVAARAAALSGEVDSPIADLRAADASLEKARRVRLQAVAEVERARVAAVRHVRQSSGGKDQGPTHYHADTVYVLRAVENQFGLIPAESLVQAEKERQRQYRVRLDFTRDQAIEIGSLARTGLEAARQCGSSQAAPDLSWLEASVARAREEANLARAADERANGCRQSAQRIVDQATPKDAGSWDLSGRTETLSESKSAAPADPAAGVGPSLSDLAGAVAARIAACDYRAASGAAAALERSHPEHPWVQKNRASIAELNQLVSLDLNAAIRQANVHLSGGNDRAWAETLAPFLKAGCQAPALQQHLARARATRDGRGAERDSLMAGRVGAGHARAERNAAAFRSAATGLMQTASALAAARQQTSTGASGSTSGSTSGSGGLPTTAATGGSPRPQPTSPTTAPDGSSDACVAMDRGPMQGRRYVVVEYFGGRGFDLIPYNPSIGDFQPPQSRVIGRYSSHAPARAALDRACPASRRIAMPGF